ncbi:MAG: cysteine--tRNA ligase [Phycisphaerae bacterium]|nr:cysteine--tRNA ligase [Phycisphaerae bacterium]
MSLKLHNTLTRKTEEFRPVKELRIEQGKFTKPSVGIYVCGPTVYGHAHLGHAKSYISFDVLVRYLRYLGYPVTYVQNITDVGHLTDNADEGEDKLVVAAAKEKKHPMALAEFYTRSYFEDMDALNCVRPDISPRASGHIPEQIELVKTLIKKGYAYKVNGSVYFDVLKFKDYGKLSGRNVEEMIAGARIEISKEKRNSADFALWKKAEPNHIMQWNSPWGKGYPGWHLECSVMSTKYLGQPFDIHGGGLENQFPHHECEIAQSEAATGKQFVKYWLHNNMVTVDGQKMGKSLGNFITLKQVFKGEHEKLSKAYSPLAVRQLVLNSHYRSPIDFSDAALFAAQSGYNKITEAIRVIREAIRKKTNSEGQIIDNEISPQLQKFKTKFEVAMNDDLNTSVALSVLFELVRFAEDLHKANNIVPALRTIDDLFTQLGGVLGIVKDEYEQENRTSDIQRYKLAIDSIIELRSEFKRNKDFRSADKIREGLGSAGIIPEDGPNGTSWRLG